MPSGPPGGDAAAGTVRISEFQSSCFGLTYAEGWVSRVAQGCIEVHW